MKIRKQTHWRPRAPRLKKKLSFEQRMMRLMKFSLKSVMIGAAVALSRMSDDERAQFLSSLTKPAPFLPPRL